MGSSLWPKEVPTTWLVVVVVTVVIDASSMRRILYLVRVDLPNWEDGARSVWLMIKPRGVLSSAKPKRPHQVPEWLSNSDSIATIVVNKWGSRDFKPTETSGWSRVDLIDLRGQAILFWQQPHLPPSLMGPKTYAQLLVWQQRRLTVEPNKYWPLLHVKAEYLLGGMDSLCQLGISTDEFDIDSDNHWFLVDWPLLSVYRFQKLRGIIRLLRYHQDNHISLGNLL